MNPTSHAPVRTSAVVPLPPASEVQVAALIELLAPLLEKMPVAWVEERRRYFMTHFSACGGSFAVSERIVAFLDEHLAARAIRATPKAIQAPQG